MCPLNKLQSNVNSDYDIPTSETPLGIARHIMEVENGEILSTSINSERVSPEAFEEMNRKKREALLKKHNKMEKKDVQNKYKV